MAIIDLALPLDGQPRYLDVLRADVPFKFVYVPPLGRESLARPAEWFDARGGGLLERGGPSGYAVYGGSGRAERWTGIETGADFTVIAVVLDSSGRGTNRNPIDADNGATVGRNWQLRFGTTNRLEFFVFNTSISAFGTGPTATSSATDPSVMVGRVANGVVNSWLNGIGGTPVTITGTQQTLTASELLGVGGRVDSGGAVPQIFGGDLYGVFVIAGALPEGLIQSFTSPDKVWAWAFEPREIQVFVPAGAADPALTGNSATASTGTPTPSISLGVEGSAATGTQGTVAPALSLATTGNSATASTGAPVASLTIALTGQGATASSGAVSPDGSATVALSGNAATTTVGTPVASITIALSGNASAAAVGSVGAPTGDITLALTGGGATASAGVLGTGAVGVGGYGDDKPKRKKRFVVKVGDKLVEYGSASAAAKALNAAPEAKPEPVAEVPIRKIKAQARVFKAEQQIQNLFKQQDFEAMLALYEQMQDEDDIETLLMLV